MKKKLFLIDGIGALISAISLSVTLPFFQKYIGLPLNILYWLSLPAYIFFINSFSVYFLAKSKIQNWMTIIAMSNLMYCLLTGSILIIYQNNLKLFGWGYFIAEIIIVLILVKLEFSMAKKLQSSVN